MNQLSSLTTLISLLRIHADTCMCSAGLQTALILDGFYICGFTENQQFLPVPCLLSCHRSPCLASIEAEAQEAGRSDVIVMGTRRRAIQSCVKPFLALWVDVMVTEENWDLGECCLSSASSPGAELNDPGCIQACKPQCTLMQK